ncbi:hypothetical protein LC724_01340 [Blautia sp. RD014234]|nr:hypothetical protein [Blautia parvula]
MYGGCGFDRKKHFYGIEEELYHAYHDAQEDICFDLCGAADMLSVFEILAGSKTGKNIIAVLSFTETASDEGYGTDVKINSAPRGEKAGSCWLTPWFGPRIWALCG